MLRLDHLILRSPEPAATVAALRDAGLPVLAPLTALAGGGLRSAILRAGPVDVEVLAVGDPPAQVEGYGIGFDAAGEDLGDVAARLRAAGIATSPPLAGRAGDRAWRALHLRGLLPDPFPAGFTTRPPGLGERLAAGVLGAAARLGPVARAGTRRSGGSMAVVTEYGFDVEAWRAAVAPGPAVTGVEVGVGGCAAGWAALGPLAGPPLDLRGDGAPGVRRIVLAGAGWEAGRAPLVLGAVTLTGG
jgi:hypothetical protein